MMALLVRAEAPVFLAIGVHRASDLETTIRLSGPSPGVHVEHERIPHEHLRVDRLRKVVLDDVAILLTFEIKMQHVLEAATSPVMTK